LKTIKSINVGSAVLYGAILAAFWTLVFGLVYWIVGWITGASSAYIDMNMGNWTMFTFATLLAVFGKALISSFAGAVGGLVVAVVYNFVAGAMGGLKINIE
jgi:hypothetical protein